MHRSIPTALGLLIATSNLQIAADAQVQSGASASNGLSGKMPVGTARGANAVRPTSTKIAQNNGTPAANQAQGQPSAAAPTTPAGNAPTDSTPPIDLGPASPGSIRSTPGLPPAAPGSAGALGTQPTIPDYDRDNLLTPQPRGPSRTLMLSPIPPSLLLPIGKGQLPPIKLEAAFNEPISLRDVLTAALENNLPIKISRENFNAQRYSFYGALGRFLPSYNTTFRRQSTWVEGGSGASTTRTYSNSITAPVFQGGRVMFNSMVNYYRMRANRFAYSATINDVLLDVYRRYNDVILNEALLNIRLRSMETSRAQLRIAEQQKAAGTGTEFAVMQSRTQLALDKQALLQQEVALRQASLRLALSINMNLSANLLPQQRMVKETPLIDPALPIQSLNTLAINNRPELKQYDALRLAARRNIQVAASPLYPTFQFFMSANKTVIESVGGGGGGGRGGGGATFVGTGSSSNFASSFAPTTSATPTQGLVASTSTPVTTTSGATSGITGTTTAGTTSSGTTAAGTGAGTGAVAGAVSSAAAASQAAAGGAVIIPSGGGGTSIAVGGGAGLSFTAGFDLSWSLGSLGVPDMMNIMSARAIARQTLLQANQQYITILEGVRESYLNSLTALEQVDVAQEGVASASEGLRLANLRYKYGVGTNLELIQAQRDYVSALINQVQAIVGYNNAQAQLVHDVGTINIEVLTTGYPKAIGVKPGSLPNL